MLLSLKNLGLDISLDLLHFKLELLLDFDLGLMVFLEILLNLRLLLELNLRLLLEIRPLVLELLAILLLLKEILGLLLIHNLCHFLEPLMFLFELNAISFIPDKNRMVH